MCACVCVNNSDAAKAPGVRGRRQKRTKAEAKIYMHIFRPAWNLFFSLYIFSFFYIFLRSLPSRTGRGTIRSTGGLRDLPAYPPMHVSRGPAYLVSGLVRHTKEKKGKEKKSKRTCSVFVEGFLDISRTSLPPNGRPYRCEMRLVARTALCVLPERPPCICAEQWSGGRKKKTRQEISSKISSYLPILTSLPP